MFQLKNVRQLVTNHVRRGRGKSKKTLPKTTTTNKDLNILNFNEYIALHKT